MILAFKKAIFKMVLIFLSVISLSGFTSIDPNEFHKSSLSIEKQSDGSELLRIKYNGQPTLVVLPNLELNHAKKIKSSLPYQVIVTRLLNETHVEIDGKNFTLPNPKASLTARIQKKLPVRKHVNRSIYISGHKMNADQIRVIKEAFRSIGIEQPIRFSEHNISLLHAEEIQIFTKEFLIREENKGRENNKLLIETKIEKRP